MYSPPRLVPAAQRAGLKARLSMDLSTGYDFRKPEGLKRSRQELKQRRPAVLLACPPCRTLSPLRGLSNYKRDAKVVREEEQEGEAYLEHALDAIEFQLSHGRGFLFERPWTSQAWKHPRVIQLLERKDMYMIRVDMCAFGLKVWKGPTKDLLAQKPTGLVSNIPELLEFVEQRCSKDHRHGKLLGGNAAHAQVYPPY